MSGECDLKRLVNSMQPELVDETYVYVTTQENRDWKVLKPKLVFEETEGTTLIVPMSMARLDELEYVFPCRMITLNIHSSLEAVGFMAAVATKLAAAGIGVNPVAGYFHDHLFVAADHAEDALVELRALAREY
ncbi:MAG: ACT domain-containing protein [Kordiimonas sp.]